MLDPRTNDLTSNWCCEIFDVANENGASICHLQHEETYGCTRLPGGLRQRWRDVERESMREKESERWERRKEREEEESMRYRYGKRDTGKDRQRGRTTIQL